MSIFYATGNNETAKKLFQKRTIYRAKMLELGVKHIVNFNFGEKFLYGRVNRLTFIPIVLKGFFLPLKPFKKKLLNSEHLSAAAFVVDAFQDLVQQFEKCAMQGRITPNDPFLSNVKVYKAYQDPQRLYDAYLKNYFAALKEEFERKNIQVRDFESFIREVLLLLQTCAPILPLTYPAFIKSRQCPAMCSGLAIEIADLDVSNDEEKITQFVNSKNWQFYINACNDYGFMIDENIPWRIVADIDSEGMGKYAARYGLTTADAILGTAYKFAHLEYYDKFKYDLLRLYNYVKLDQMLVTEECGINTIAKIVVPDSYSAEHLFQLYSDEYFLNLYFRIRFMEEESTFSAPEKNELMDDSTEIYLNRGSTAALNAFERILNKPFDYRGSLSYINTVAKARE